MRSMCGNRSGLATPFLSSQRSVLAFFKNPGPRKTRPRQTSPPSHVRTMSPSAAPANLSKARCCRKSGRADHGFVGAFSSVRRGPLHRPARRAETLILPVRRQRERAGTAGRLGLKTHMITAGQGRPVQSVRPWGISGSKKFMPPNYCQRCPCPRMSGYRQSPAP